jgi:alkylated DNA nucleotide flippase Atl1
LTIEHVLPQTLTDAVRDTFARSLPEEADVAYEHDRLVHTIGNLTLTGYNSELSNHPFTTKRTMLAESGLRMNRAIASHKTWGAAEITQRGSDLAEKIIDLWPGPDETLAGTEAEEPTSFRRLVALIVAEIPAGRWTSYGEVALVAGSYPQPVAAVITSHHMQAAWRVLQAGGTVSPGFRWLDADRTEDPRDFLRSEGLSFGPDDHADVRQFISAEELARLTGLDVDRDRLQAPETRPLLAQRQRFFQRVRDLGEASETTIKSWPTASTEYAANISLGIPGTAIVLSLYSREPAAVFCAFYLRDNKASYQRLLSRRDEIEASVGAELEWQDSPGVKSNQVALRCEGIGATMSTQRNWLNGWF